MDGHASAPHHAPVRVLPHIKRLDDCFGYFLVRVWSALDAAQWIRKRVDIEELQRTIERHGRIHAAALNGDS